MSRVPALVAIGACIGLALLNWQLLTQEIDISPAVLAEDAEAGLPTIEGTPADIVASPPGRYPETLARPLFRSRRRPLEAAKPQAAATPAAPKRVAKLPDGIALVGIMKESGRAERALIRSGESPTGEWIELGQLLGGWRLSRIETASVLFEAEGQKQNLSLFPVKEE